MSLANKLEGFRAEVEAKRTIEELKKGKDSLGDIVARKNALSARITELDQALSGLNQSYGQAESDLGSFKKTKGDIKGMYGEYEETLKEHGINSAPEMLTNPEFANEPEVKEYFAKSPAKEKKATEYASQEEAQTAEKKRGRLGGSIKELSQAKSKAKELMPEADLSFSGGKARGKETSRRQESLDKIREERDLLRKELNEVIEEEKKAEKEYMPKIEKLIEEKLDRLLPAGQGHQSAAEAADAGVIYRRFVPDQIFEVCGNFWPEAKKTIQEAIEKYFREREINISPDNINRSLEAEKILYDADSLKNKYGDVLRMEHEGKALGYLENKLDDPFRYGMGRAAFRSGKAIPESILLEAESLNGKNPEAKKIAEGVLTKLKVALLEEKGKIKNGLLDGRETKADKEKVRKIIGESLKELDNLEAPDDFFQANRYNFINKLSNSKPYILGDKWVNDIWNRLEKTYQTELDSLNGLIIVEGEALYKLSNDLYNSRTYGSSRNESLKIGGFDIPATNLEKCFEGYEINDMARLRNFFNSLEGKNMDKAEFRAVLKETVDSYQKDIDSVPGARKAIQDFDSLRANSRQFIQRNYELLDTKMDNRGYWRASRDSERNVDNLGRKIFGLKA